MRPHLLASILFATPLAAQALDALPMSGLNTPQIAGAMKDAEDIGNLRSLVRQRNPPCAKLAETFNRVEESQLAFMEQQGKNPAGGGGDIRDFLNIDVPPERQAQVQQRTPEETMAGLFTFFAQWKNADRVDTSNLHTVAVDILKKQCGATFEPFETEDGLQNQIPLLKRYRAILPTLKR